MRFSLFSLLPLALAAPTYPSLDLSAANAQDGVDALSDYFNFLADKTRRYKALDAAPACELSRAVLPTAPDPLPAPEEGAHILHVALGRGTQNYTCANETTAPAATGAVATLFDISCLSATQPALLPILSRLSISYDPTPHPFTVSPTAGNAGFGDGPVPELGATALAVSGVHYFTSEGVPFFDLERAGVGHVGVGKNASAEAPGDAGVGPEGEKAVSWLRLVAGEGADTRGGLEEVYRVDTVGGSPPGSCEGMPETFKVEYSAQYWFLGRDE